jgi:hypothetical protein
MNVRYEELKTRSVHSGSVDYRSVLGKTYVNQCGRCNTAGDNIQRAPDNVTAADDNAMRCAAAQWLGDHGTSTACAVASQPVRSLGDHGRYCIMDALGEGSFGAYI